MKSFSNFQFVRQFSLFGSSQQKKMVFRGNASRAHISGRIDFESLSGFNLPHLLYNKRDKDWEFLRPEMWAKNCYPVWMAHQNRRAAQS
jgi:hypothetical protein